MLYLVATPTLRQRYPFLALPPAAAGEWTLDERGHYARGLAFNVAEVWRVEAADVARVEGGTDPRGGRLHDYFVEVVERTSTSVRAHVLVRAEGYAVTGWPDIWIDGRPWARLAAAPPASPYPWVNELAAGKTAFMIDGRGDLAAITTAPKRSPYGCLEFKLRSLRP